MDLGPLKILLLEDSANDVQLIERELKKLKKEFKIKVVDTEEGFTTSLEEFKPDIILSDHNLPSFNSIKALQKLKDIHSEIPFILLSGNISPEFAVSSIKFGAYDYIMKDRMERLPTAILNALEKYSIQKTSQYEIERNEKKFKILVENAGDMISMIDAKGYILYVSPAVKYILGYEPDELLGKKFFTAMTDEQAEESQKIFDELLKKPGVPYNRVSRFKTKDGRKLWMEGVVTNMLDDENVRAVIANHRDITERKNADEDRIKLAYDIFKRNKELEQFTYIVSHNLRAPLSNIIGFANEITESNSDDEKELFMSELLKAVTRLDEVILDLNELLALKHQGREKKEDIDLKEILDSVKLSIKNIIDREKVEINCDFGKLPSINSIRSYMHSIFYNLILNSIKYKQPNVSPIIDISSGLKDGNIIISIKDNGRGIDLTKKRDQVFGLYKKFHPEIEGKGLGLFMVKSQVELLGGVIRIESQPDSGTKFDIKFYIEPEN
ncbi:hypothetical protein BH10BAC5_BH10BAC5_22810 [soil metagenome]